MAGGLRQVAGLPDPVGEVLDGWVRPNGLRIQRVRVPLGVVAIIYENRPNVTSDAAGLCLKSGNAAFLRGSSGAISSNLAIAAVLREAVAKAGLPADAVTLVADTSRETAVEFMRLRESIDCLIPRRRTVADPLDPRQRHRALRDRRRRQLPRVRGRRRRPRHGARHRRQRQDPAAVGVQRGRDAARARGRRRRVPPEGRRGPRRGRAARRRAHLLAGARPRRPTRRTGRPSSST